MLYAQMLHPGLFYTPAQRRIRDLYFLAPILKLKQEQGFAIKKNSNFIEFFEFNVISLVEIVGSSVNVFTRELFNFLRETRFM